MSASTGWTHRSCASSGSKSSNHCRRIDPHIPWSPPGLLKMSRSTLISYARRTARSKSTSQATSTDASAPALTPIMFISCSRYRSDRYLSTPTSQKKKLTSRRASKRASKRVSKRASPGHASTRRPEFDTYTPPPATPRIGRSSCGNSGSSSTGTSSGSSSVELR